MSIDHKSTSKLKIAFPIIVLVSIFLLLIINSISVKYFQQQSLNNLEKRVILVTKVSELLHELQKERGMTVGYLSGDTQDFQEKLSLQKKATDRALFRLKSYYKNNDFPIFEYHTKTLKYLSKLNKMRALIKVKVISSTEANHYYTYLNNTLLNTVLSIVKTSTLTEINNDAIAYVNLLYYEENSGLERAMGTNILSIPAPKQKMINLFNSYIVKEDVYKDLFLKFASYKFKEIYLQNIELVDFSKIIDMREAILSGEERTIQHIEPYDWFKSLTKMIDVLKSIDHQLSQEMLYRIGNEYKESRNSFFNYIILGVIIFIIFIMMIMIILRLKKSETKLKNLVNQYVISSTTDLKGTITGVSKAFCDISGYTEEELIGKPHKVVRHPDMPKELFKEVWRTIESGKIWQGEVKNRRKNGDYYWVTAVISPLYNNGKKVGYSSIRQDITDSKRIEELNESLKEKISLEVAKSRQKDQQMIQQSRLAQMGEMISMIAHQWRQPLTAISATGSSMILTARGKELVESAYIDEKSRKILEYSKHLSNTIDDFRDFFKPDKEQKLVTIEELTKSVLGIVKASLCQQNIKIDIDIRYHEKFTSYPNELKQVILNLIKNAEDVLLENGIENPWIKIDGYKKDDSIIIEVKDNGKGVPEGLMDKIFDPYFSTKLKKDGTGLGLYMSKTIVEDHCHGKLELKNNVNGAVFMIILPLSKKGL